MTKIKYCVILYQMNLLNIRFGKIEIYGKLVLFNRSMKKSKNQQQISSQLEQISVEKNMILTILTQMAQNMLLFNFKIGDLKDIMYKFLDFFELNKEITYDLLMQQKDLKNNKKQIKLLKKKHNFKEHKNKLNKHNNR
ncbi:unnamed protein product [Paramecium sonneborni]|uniref:Uncharacterized protein n=1 Tax=Paramecium sonneborni TaxID=65129 RepID=A0A8S1NNZ4_9CILI|nr:unnamed protein product [Paramecium sonneborni]